MLRQILQSELCKNVRKYSRMRLPRIIAQAQRAREKEALAQGQEAGGQDNGRSDSQRPQPESATATKGARSPDQGHIGSASIGKRAFNLMISVYKFYLLKNGPAGLAQTSRLQFECSRELKVCDC